MKLVATMLLLLLLLAGASALAEVSYNDFDFKGWSRSRHISEESQILLSLNLIEQGIQNQDLRQVAVAACPELSDHSIDSLVAKFGSTFAGLINDGEELLPTTNVGLYGGTINAFRWFDFEADSVITTRNGATAYVRGSWLTPGDRGRGEGEYSLAFSKTGNRWHPSDLAAVMVALSDYLGQTAGLLQVRSELAEPSSRDAYDDYSEFLSFSSKHLLLERDIMSQHPRFTASVADQEYGERVFSCLGQPGSFHYEGDDPIVGNLSVSAIADPCWQRFLVGNYVPGEEEEWFIWARGKTGTAGNLHDFRQPGGLEFRTGDMLYICDRGNNRIKVVSVKPQLEDKLSLLWIIDNVGLNDPIDLDVSIEGMVAVAEYGSNSVTVFCDHPSNPYPWQCGEGQKRYYLTISRPVSISWGRDPVTGEKTSAFLYVVDQNGRRILGLTSVFSGNPGTLAFSEFPDPITQISGISVDNHGQVWAVDHEKGRVYRFSAMLDLLAIHGAEGTGYAEYLYPAGLSFAQAYQYVAEYEPPAPMPAMAEVVLTEEWGPTTGVRRLVAGVDILDTYAHYFPELEDGTSDYIDLHFRTTGYSDNEVKLYSPTDELLETKNYENYPTDSHYSRWWLPAGPGSGTYTFSITAQSVNINANTATAILYVDVDRSIVNQRPVITNMFFMQPDSCFLIWEWEEVGIAVSDEDTSQLSYYWYTDPAGVLALDDIYENPCRAQYTGWLREPDEGRANPKFLKVYVEDQHGQRSYTRSMVLDPLVKTSSNDCLTGCRVGDANGDGMINITDAVFVIGFIFNNGPAPEPLITGDGNCDGVVNITDAVYFIQWIYNGGPVPGQCCNCDTSWCE